MLSKAHCPNSALGMNEVRRLALFLDALHSNRTDEEEIGLPTPKFFASSEEYAT